MTQEDKELLKDLCARLPYGVKVEIYNHWTDDYEDETLTLKNYGELIDTFCVEDIKPYLFPMSSMTEEQEREYLNTCNGYCTYYWTYETIDWLNQNHFDYRGLIEKSLALDATGLNIYEQDLYPAKKELLKSL